MIQPANPTARRRQLAAALRAGRVRAELTIEQVADHLMCSAAKISRLETGQRAASLRDVRDLCNLYDVAAAERDRLMEIAKESRERGWWESYDLTTTYSSYVGFESIAKTIRDFKSSIIPGIFQTEEYARALTSCYLSGESELALDRLIELRLVRQRTVLNREHPPILHSVLDEATLHRCVGGPAVMEEQLEKLHAVATRPFVTIQVIPFSAGAHPGVETTFTILEFEEESLRTVVYVEDVFGDLQLDRPNDLGRSEKIFEGALAHALPPEASLALIDEIRDRYAAEPS